TRAGANLLSCDYNFDRLRVKKISASGETRYLYDQSSVLTEYGGASGGFSTVHKYDYGYHLLSMSTPASSARDFYLNDALGSIVNLTDTSGGTKQTYLYDAWGRLRAQNGTSDNQRQYTGHYKDTETADSDQQTDLHYFGARYYDEEQGRFLSQDAYLGEANNPP